MSQAIVDPDELRQFAANLKQYAELISDATTTLQLQFTRLGETWRDQEQAKFANDFDETVQVIRRFHEAAGQHIPFLEQKAKEVDQYLGR